MRELFKVFNFKADTLKVILQANDIIEEYAEQGFKLTLRQIYYQFVARDIISNTKQSYDRLGSIINNGRLGGLIDWEAIEDRTRNLEVLPHWETAADAIDEIAEYFAIDMWANQPRRVEVWIEKEALVGVIADTCDALDVPYFACRGYVSQSEVWRAYKRSCEHPLTILHFGDHDPSGIDMTRDNRERLADVFGGDVELERLALTMDQIDEYSPPPNPAKVTDSRFDQYLIDYGDESWELDALEPKVINDLIKKHVDKHINEDLWEESLYRQADQKALLGQASEYLQR